MSPEEAEEALERHFLATAKKGVVLSAARLAEYARKKGIPHTADALRQMRHRFKFSAFASRFQRPPHYMSASVSRYGICQLDLGVFEPAHRRQNRGCGAFLLSVEMLSQQLQVVPCRDGTTASWEAAVTKMAETGFNAVRTLVTDRDSAVKSQAFRDRIKEKFGISWTWLKNRNKVRAASAAAAAAALLTALLPPQAFKSERYIGHCKNWLSQAMRANGDKRWVHLLPRFVADHNAGFVTGTDVVRSTVNQHNYVGLLAKMFKTESPTLLFNVSGMEDLPGPLAKLVWRHEVGDKVLLARRSDFSLKGKNSFEKVSVVGAYGPEVHTVARRMAKNNAKLFVTPVYGLAKLPGTWFYENELKPALFAEADKGAAAQKRRRELLRLRRARKK